MYINIYESCSSGVVERRRAPRANRCRCGTYTHFVTFVYIWVF